MLESIRSWFANKVILIVSHKVSQLLSTDLVIVIHNCTIAQSGPPQDLLQQEGVFKRLYQLQYRISDLQFEREYHELEKELV